MSDEMILNLVDVDRKSIERVGGKGANLGELISNQFPVPEGFCVSVLAYNRFISENNLQEKIDQIIKAVNWNDVSDIEQKSNQIRTAIVEQDIHPEMEQKIIDAYKILENKKKRKVYVAVRSSATAEDLLDASFAGQQETFLYVEGKQELLHYIKSCWASLWSARAMAYRNNRGYDHNKVFISVVVQEMVNASVSGILFTSNPLTQKKDEILITSSYGLGELIVSGQVTPDSFIIDKKKMDISSKELGTKEKQMVMSEENRTKIVDVAIKKQNQFSLTTDQLKELAQLAVKVEKHYGFPQDIEWAFADGELFLLQSRPITTINKEEQFQLGKLSKTQIMLLDDLLEHYPEAPTPLDYSVVIMSYHSLLNRGEELGIGFSKATDIIQMDREGKIRLQPPKIKVKWRILLLLSKLIKASKTNNNHYNELEQETQSYWARMRKLEPKNLSTQSLLSELDHVFDLAKKISDLRFQFIVDQTMLPVFCLSTITKFHKNTEKRTISDIITTNLEFKTSVIDKKLVQLAISISQHKEVKTYILEGDYTDIEDFKSKLLTFTGGKEIWKEIESFLEQYGYRTDKMYQPFKSKSWLDDPMYFLDILKAVLHDTQLLDRKRKERERNEKHQLWLSDFKKRVKGPILPLFHWGYKTLRRIYIQREETVFNLELIFHYGRRMIHELGIRLESEGFLEEPRDIVYIKKEELSEVISNRVDKEQFLELIKLRKGNMANNQQNWKQSIIQLSQKAGGNGDVITGISGSSGLAEGPVRMITKVDDFNKLKQGDILVCQYTDPAWTPLFGIAAAVVADTGGPLSHAAIVAREYGIPAVLGSKVGSSILKDGEVIIVDGTEGRVTRK